MAKDDYFVLVNKFLRYLYKCLKQNIAPDWNLLAPNTKDFPVHEEYFTYMPVSYTHLTLPTKLEV